MNALSPCLRPHRHDVSTEAEVIRACGNSGTVPVADLSIDGCSVCGWFSAGDRLTIALPRIGKFEAGVRWAPRGRSGLRFERSG
ncbi:hypothetical protein [Sphingomonas sp. LHG3406-1]|uniref:hypothetical protein n=1 Tax=Sphingomonas sp. LHG3406-1 TaxID=2804617 RepID=UPI002608C89B|nr:hypothetical protein [Sphingomonas sp. LHG3406-1]